MTNNNGTTTALRQFETVTLGQTPERNENPTSKTGGVKRPNEDSNEESPAKRHKADKDEEEEDCCVCRDRKVKYTLECTGEHGFCHTCIENWALEKGQTFSCPCCREECTLPDDWWQSIRHLARAPTDSETEDDYDDIDLTDSVNQEISDEELERMLANMSNDEDAESDPENTLSMQCDALLRRSDALTLEQATLQRELQELRRQNEALMRRHNALRRRRDMIERRALALREFIIATESLNNL